MYHVRCLAKLHIDNRIIAMFYNCVVSSVLCYAISCWYKRLNKYEKKAVERPRKKVVKIISSSVHHIIEDIQVVHKSRCLSLLKTILNDNTHPLYNCFVFLPHGRLDMPSSNTSRYHDSFVPTVVKLCN